MITNLQFPIVTVILTFIMCLYSIIMCWKAALRLNNKSKPSGLLLLLIITIVTFAFPIGLAAVFYFIVLDPSIRWHVYMALTCIFLVDAIAIFQPIGRFLKEEIKSLQQSKDVSSSQCS